MSLFLKKENILWEVMKAYSDRLPRARAKVNQFRCRLTNIISGIKFGVT